MPSHKQQPTVIRIEGPPGSFKTTIVLLIEKWAYAALNAEVYLNEEDGAIEHGNKETARFHIYTKQTH
jgi:Ni2+-binding GTPase involved in maturation of urease and hydrogenase